MLWLKNQVFHCFCGLPMADILPMRLRPKGYLSSPAISDSTESPGVRLRTGDPSTCPGQANTGHQTDKWSECIPVALVRERHR